MLILTVATLLAQDPQPADAQRTHGADTPEIQRLVAWAEELKPPYSINTTVTMARLDSGTPTTAVLMRGTVDRWVQDLKSESHAVDFELALRSYLAWVGPMALPREGGLLISRFAFRTDGDSVLETRREGQGHVTSRLLARGLALGYDSGQARLRIAPQEPRFHRSLFNLERLFYPLGIDEASRSWYSAGDWERRGTSSDSWCLQRVEEDGFPGSLLIQGQGRGAFPNCILKEWKEDGQSQYVLAFFKSAWVQRSGTPFRFVSEVLVFDTLALRDRVQMKRILIGDVSFDDEIDLRLPVPFQDLEKMQDTRFTPTRTFSADMTEWPTDFLDLIRSDA